ncbi:MAG: LytTR family DNA-binding domain-containing protein [Steroidobacteraceae bacterium]
MNLLIVDDEPVSSSTLPARARGVPRLTRARRPHAAAPTPAPGAGGAGRPLFLVGEREHRLYPLDPFEINYVQSAGNYVTYHLAGVEYIARESIKRLEAVLAPAGFVRIERSLLLNVRAIAYAQPIGHGSFVFTLASGARLRSGHAYRDTILTALPLRRRAPTHAGLPSA